MCPPLAIADEETRAMRAHVRRLRRDDPVRSVAQAVLDASPPGLARFGPLLAALAEVSDRRWRRRAVAAWALGRVPLDEAQRQQAAQALGEVVLDNRRSTSARLLSRAKWTAKRLGIVAVIGAVLLAAGRYLERLASQRDAWDAGPYQLWGVLIFLSLFALVLMVPVIPFVSFFVDTGRTKPARQTAAESLARLGVPESVGALARVARGHGCLPRTAYLRPLRRLLPLLTPEHYGLLESRTIPDLCRLLDPDLSDSVTMCLILDALGKMGDGRAVAPVERLARRAWLPEVKAAAEAVLPILRARQQAERNPRLLLRAAAQPGEAAGVLLRPAGSAQGEEAANLLRTAEAVGTADEADS